MLQQRPGVLRSSRLWPLVRPVVRSVVRSGSGGVCSSRSGVRCSGSGVCGSRSQVLRSGARTCELCRSGSGVLCSGTGSGELLCSGSGTGEVLRHWLQHRLQCWLLQSGLRFVLQTEVLRC